MDKLAMHTSHYRQTYTDVHRYLHTNIYTIQKCSLKREKVRKTMLARHQERWLAHTNLHRCTQLTNIYTAVEMNTHQHNIRQPSE